MAAKVIRIPEFRGREVETSDDAFHSEAPAGWDPYEVWRTRVLQPRLDETRPVQAAAEPSSKRSFLARLLRKKND
jgi:hypothetical protein